MGEGCRNNEGGMPFKYLEFKDIHHLRATTVHCFDFMLTLISGREVDIHVRGGGTNVLICTTKLESEFLTGQDEQFQPC